MVANSKQRRVGCCALLLGIRSKLSSCPAPRNIEAVTIQTSVHCDAATLGAIALADASLPCNQIFLYPSFLYRKGEDMIITAKKAEGWLEITVRAE